MSILCRLGGHEAAAGETSNSGYWFGRCRKCGRDMLRSGARWEPVPDGHRVVWKSGRHSHSLQPDYAGVLPTLHRDANLPAVRPPFASWSRQLMRLAGRGIGRPAEPEPRDEPAERPYPGLLIVAALVGASLQLVFGFGDRARQSHGPA
ncbi:MAG: hypothetical protein ACK40O_04525 [Allosphingosinicella sp.]